MKKRKIEPTFPRIVAACPAAIINPATGKPVDKKLVYSVFRQLMHCGASSFGGLETEG